MKEEFIKDCFKMCARIFNNNNYIEKNYNLPSNKTDKERNEESFPYQMATRNGYSIRYMVQDFIKHALKKKDFEWENGPTLTSNAPNVHIAMRNMGDEMERQYKSNFEQMCSELPIDRNSAQSTFNLAADEIFHGGVNWGRVVALFVFNGILARRFVEENHSDLIDSLVDWTTNFVETQLKDWLQSHGGWDGFLEFYENGHQSETKWDLSRVLRYGVLVGAVALGGFSLVHRT